MLVPWRVMLHGFTASTDDHHGVFGIPRNVVSGLRRAAVDFFHLPVREKEKTNTGRAELGSFRG